MAATSALKVPVGVYPLATIMGFAIVGLGYFLNHKLRQPDIVYARRTNPEPYQSVQQGQTIKLYDPNNNFTSKWSRNAL